MKKRLFSMLLCLLIAVSVATPALAVSEYGNYYDETGALWTQELQTMAEETLPAVIDAYGLDMRIDVLTKISDSGIAATAKNIYESYGYGYGANKDGVSLTLYVLPDDDGWYVEYWYVYVGGSGSAWKGLENYLYDYVDDGFTFDAWDGDVSHDSLAMTQIVGLLSSGVAQYATENGTAGGGAQTPPADITPIVSDAVLGFGEEGNVVDLSGVLSMNQDAVLEEMISSIANPYQCGCYIVVTDNLYEYGEDASDAVINLYHDNNLGIGEGRDGILLLLDPVNRKFAFFVYGDNAEYIFNAYGQEQLEQVFLDDFGNDLWYDGLEDFVAECGEYMELAAQGNPVAKSKTIYYVGAVLGALVIAAIVCAVLVMQMKSVATANDAANYVAAGGLMLTQRSDVFAYKSTTTRDLSDDDDNDSSSFSGGGGSGRSGSF